VVEVLGCAQGKGNCKACGSGPACACCDLRRLLQETRAQGRAECDHALSLAAGGGRAGDRVWYSLKTQTPVIAGEPHLFLIMEDITTTKQTERQVQEAREMAEEASRLKSRFLSNVSHEIRTPLNGIMGFAEAILHGESLEGARAQAQIIVRESTILLMLVNDLLDLVKIESGRLVLERAPVDLGEMLRELSQTAGRQARAKGLTFVASVDVDAPGRIQSDPLRLRQILLNLVSNAIKFTQTGSVRVAVEACGAAGAPQVRVSVADTGIGIPPDKQEVIFESFAQADVSTTRQFGGTGLGLAIVRQLVHLMGGAMGLDSLAGAGSTFWFTLPAQAASETEEKSPCTGCDEQSERNLRPGRILLAEDYPTNQDIARHFLEQVGHEVTVVSNGKLAVDQCAEITFDVILMDLHMPVMDGVTAVAKIRAGTSPNRAVPIVALTASADRQTQASCLDCGFNDVLTKPIRRRALLCGVDRWLRRAARPAADLPIVAALAAESVAKAPSAPPPMDLATAIAEFGGRAPVVHLLEDFLEHAATQMQTLHAAVAVEERDAVRQAAHALKGAAASLEAVPLATAAGRLETASADGLTADLGALVEAVAAEVGRLHEFAQDIQSSRGEDAHAHAGD
ncbi:MAG TPA: ATP-binding protein, partial [Phycisphaerae bacterium]|nr:ATP-binding protein [Phycisphaerae bacterium]